MMDGKAILDQKLILNNMNKILFVIMLGLTFCHSNRQESLSSNSLFLTDSLSAHFDVSYKDVVGDEDFSFEVLHLSDSLEIRYLSTGYNAEYEGGGWGFMIAIPKDTTVSKICNTKRFSEKQWKLRSEFVIEIKNKMVEKALSDEVEKYFDVFFYYTRQEYLYVNGGAVTDDGREVPDYSFRDNTPIEEYQLKDGQWKLTNYISDRGTSADHSFGREKASRILKERFGQMAEEMERKK